MALWHVTQKVILLVGLSLKGITQGGGGQGGACKVHGWDKLMLPVVGYLVWEGGLYGVIAGVGVERWMR